MVGHKKKSSLFVFNIDPSIISTSLWRETMNRIAPIFESDTFVKENHYAYVRFRSRRDATNFKATFDNQYLQIPNHPEIDPPLIRVCWGSYGNVLQHCVYIQLKFSEASDLQKAASLTAENLKAYFSRYGRVVKASLPSDRKLWFRYKTLKRARQQRDESTDAESSSEGLGTQKNTQLSSNEYGFAYFEDTPEGSRAAGNAIIDLSKIGKRIHTIPVLCNFGLRQATKKTDSPRNQPSGCFEERNQHYHSPRRSMHHFRNLGSPCDRRNEYFSQFPLFRPPNSPQSCFYNSNQQVMLEKYWLQCHFQQMQNLMNFMNPYCFPSPQFQQFINNQSLFGAQHHAAMNSYCSMFDPSFQEYDEMDSC